MTKTETEILAEYGIDLYKTDDHFNGQLLQAMQDFASQESKLAVEKDRESRWISVKDRLPEEGKEVLVWSDRYGRTFAALTGQNKHGSIWLYSGDQIVTFNAPSHWQPLPEGPKQNT